MGENRKRCLVCGRTESTINILLHHVSYVPEETIPLCARCHLTCAHPDKLQKMTDLMRERGTENHFLYAWLEEAPMLQGVAKSKKIVFHRRR